MVRAHAARGIRPPATHVLPDPLPQRALAAHAVGRAEHVPRFGDRDPAIHHEAPEADDRVAVALLQFEDQRLAGAEPAELMLAAMRTPEVDLVDIRQRAEVAVPGVVGVGEVAGHGGSYEL